MASKSEASGGGIGFLGLLAIVFITLKLTGYIDWPWYWVLSPLWIPVALALAVLLIVLVISAVITLIGVRTPGGPPQ